MRGTGEMRGDWKRRGMKIEHASENLKWIGLSRAATRWNAVKSPKRNLDTEKSS